MSARANAGGGESGAPTLLLHGTNSAMVSTILAEGLTPREAGWAVAPDGRDYEPCAVYLADNHALLVAVKRCGQAAERRLWNDPKTPLTCVGLTGFEPATT